MLQTHVGVHQIFIIDSTLKYFQEFSGIKGCL